MEQNNTNIYQDITILYEDGFINNGQYNYLVGKIREYKDTLQKFYGFENCEKCIVKTIDKVAESAPYTLPTVRIEELEILAIKQIFSTNRKVKLVEVANSLGITERTLYRKKIAMTKIGIWPE